MIVLEILKIIGIVLGSIVGLALLIVLAICFIPIKYKMIAEGENADIEGSAVISWLGFAKAAVFWQDKKLSYRVSVFRKALLKGTLGEDETEVLREALKEEETKEDSQKYNELSKELKKAEEKAEITKAKKEEAQIEKERQKEEKKLEKEAEKAERKEKAKNSSFMERVKERIEKFKEIKSKVDEVKRIWEAKTTKRALRHVKAEIFHILNHIKPRKISGTIDFGLEDPASTAMIYGSTAPFLEYISDGKLLITPAFYQKIISVNLLIYGRIFSGYMLLCLLRLFLDRDIQKVIKVTRRYLNG